MKLNHWETPDVVNVAWDYGTHSALFTANFTNRHQHDGLTVYGTQGTIELRGRAYFIWEEGNNKAPVEKIPPQIESHQKNWIDCIRSGKRPNAPVELGFKSLLPSLLGNIAFRRGTKVTWDADAKKVKGPPLSPMHWE